MRCHLVVPNLLPAPHQKEEFLANLEAPALSRLGSKGRSISVPVDGYEAWICQYFGVQKQNDWPLAPITLIADGKDAGDAYWLRADPVHLKINRDELVLADSTAFEITDAEAVDFT